MSAAGAHDWFKRCLEQAELPSTMQLHELRHSAADHLWRSSGNIELLRHQNVATTAGYLHPSRADLETAMRELEGARGKSN